MAETTQDMGQVGAVAPKIQEMPRSVTTYAERVVQTVGEFSVATGWPIRSMPRPCT